MRLFMILIISSVLFYPLFWCVIPGVLLLLCPIRKRSDIVEALAFVIGLSFAFWIVTAWIVEAAGVPIRPFAYAVILSTLVLSILFRRRIARVEIDNTREDRLVLLLLGVAALLRFVPLALVDVPAGADMSMHTYLTHLIVRNGSIPATFEPLLPLELYGSYALGFHTLSALTSLIARVPVHTACQIVTCMSHAFFPLAMYVLLRRFSDRWAALAATAVAAFVCALPQSLIGPGSNPTALSVDFLVIASAWLLGLKASMSWTQRIALALILTAAPLTHAIPATGYAFAVVPVILYLMIHVPIRQRESAGCLYGNVIGIGLVVVGMLIPYLLSMKAHLSGGEINWVRNWQNIAFLGGVRDLPLGLETVFGGLLRVPFAIEKKLGSVFLFISALGLITTVVRRERDRYPFILFAIILLLLILNWNSWILPLSYVLYPDRLVILLAIPLAVLGASVISRVFSRAGGRATNVLLAVGIVAASVWFYTNSYLLPAIRLSAVSDADMKAFRWIEENTDKDAVFLNNYGDAGLWIPAMTLRPTVLIQTNPVYMEEFRIQQLSLLPDYVYLGAKQVYKQNIFLSKSGLQAVPEICQMVYDSDGVTIWKASDPKALREYFWDLEEIQERVERNRQMMGI